MTRPRPIIRVFTFFTAAAMAVATFALMLPAQAHPHEELPFELLFPQEPQVTRFSNDWGAARSGGRRHRATDLIAPKMTEVYAAAPGIVEVVGTSRRAGRYVRIRHRGGWSTTYIHLNNDNPGTDDGRAPWSLTVTQGVEEGAWVQAGQLIGWVGDSGNAESAVSHTHFELAKDGHEVNPYPYLEEAYARAQELYLLRMYYDSNEALPLIF